RTCAGRRARSSGSPRSRRERSLPSVRGRCSPPGPLAAGSFPNPSRKRSGPAGPLGQLGEILLGGGKLAACLLEIGPRPIPGRLDDAVPILAVVPRIEVVLELVHDGVQLLDPRPRLLDPPARALRG